MKKGKPIGDEVFLGDWDFSIADAGIFVGSGIYVHWQYGFDKDGQPEMELKTKAKRDENGKPLYDEDGKPVAETVLNEMGFPLKTQKRLEVNEKLRGGRPKNYPTNEQGDPWLVAVTVPLWKTSLKGASAELEPAIASAILRRDATFFPYVEQPYKKFIGAGQALTEKRWTIAGRWSPDVDDLKWGDLTKRHPGFFYRTIDVHKPGGKRDIYYGDLSDVCNIVMPDRRGKETVTTARRASRLIPTIPSLNSDFDAEPRRFKTRERADQYVATLKIAAEKTHKVRLERRECESDISRYIRDFVVEPLVEWIEDDKLWSVWPMMSRGRPPSWLKRELIEGTLEIENEDDRMIAATFGGLFSRSEIGEGEDGEGAED